MTKSLSERGAPATPTVERNARYSAFARARRPLPTTRREAEVVFEPASRNAQAGGWRLHRLNVLGLLELRTTPGDPLTQGQAHEAILDAIYGPEEPHEQAAEGDGV